jgi:xylulokinase
MASRDETGTVAGFADASEHFLPLVATLNAARVLKASADLLGVGFDEFVSIALQAKSGAGGVVLLSYSEGERTPYLPSAEASLHGLDALENHSYTVLLLIIIEGGAQSQAVQKIATTVFNVNLVVPAVAESVALGSTVQAASLRE